MSSSYGSSSLKLRITVRKNVTVLKIHVSVSASNVTVIVGELDSIISRAKYGTPVVQNKGII